MDALTEVLHRCRLAGTIFSRAWLRAPWGVRSGQSAHGIFHAVTHGACWLETEGLPEGRTLLGTGDVVFLPYGAPHVLSDAPGRDAAPIGLLAQQSPPGMLRVDQGGPLTELLCGSLRFAQGDLHPLLGVLPPALVVRAEAAPTVRAITALIDAEMQAPGPGSDTVIARLTDVLLVQGIRRWLASGPEERGGWMAGLRDPQIARALSLMHSDPAGSWTLARLARQVGMSRSAFAARFSALVGEPPSGYLTRWRMSLAAEALRGEPVTLAELAGRVGYQSEYALSKAFKRTTGQSPEQFRARRPLEAARSP